jgi:hypothetical protein
MKRIPRLGAHKRSSGLLPSSFNPVADSIRRVAISLSRRDDADRSLARSAWESAPRKNRPVGYGMIGTANPRGILVVMDRFLNLGIPSHRTLQDGLFGVTLSQATPS